MTTNADIITPDEPNSKVADGDRVQRVLAGDDTAYEELVEKYQGKIYALVYNMTGNREDARDLVQDVFIKAYTALPRFKGKSSFYTWLYRIALNRTINFIQKRKKRMAMSLDDIDAGLERDPDLVDLASRESPVRNLSITELQERLNKALLTLSEKHRMVVILHDIEGVPHDEIAQMMSVSAGTVRSRLFYARQRLQAELSDMVT